MDTLLEENDIIAVILTEIAMEELQYLLSCMLVCKKWNSIAEGNTIWRTLNYNHFHVHSGMKQEFLRLKVLRSIHHDFAASNRGKNEASHAVAMCLRGEIDTLKDWDFDSPSCEKHAAAFYSHKRSHDMKNTPQYYYTWYDKGPIQKCHRAGIKLNSNGLYYVVPIRERVARKKEPDPTIFAGSLLHWAVLGGKLEIIKYLVEEQGCNVNALMTNYKKVLIEGTTPLEIARANKWGNIVFYLTPMMKWPQAELSYANSHLHIANHYEELNHFDGCGQYGILCEKLVKTQIFASMILYLDGNRVYKSPCVYTGPVEDLLLDELLRSGDGNTKISREVNSFRVNGEEYQLDGYEVLYEDYFIFHGTRRHNGVLICRNLYPKFALITTYSFPTTPQECTKLLKQSLVEHQFSLNIVSELVHMTL